MLIDKHARKYKKCEQMGEISPKEPKRNSGNIKLTAVENAFDGT